MDTKSEEGILFQQCTVPLHDLLCGGGSTQTIERFVSEVPGVRRAYANPTTEMIYVEYNPADCDLDEVVHAVERAGFRAGIPIIRR